MTESVLFTTLMSGVLSGIVVALVQHFFVWKSQTKFMQKKAAYDDAILALAMYETDAMDLDLRQKNNERTGTKYSVPLTGATHIKTAQASIAVLENFSLPAAQKYLSIYPAALGPETVPNTEFYQRRKEGMEALTKELYPDQSRAGKILAGEWVRRI